VAQFLLGWGLTSMGVALPGTAVTDRTLYLAAQASSPSPLCS
jgi:hypothetical protein